jgi:hypothetical protein
MIEILIFIQKNNLTEIQLNLIETKWIEQFIIYFNL